MDTMPQDLPNSQCIFIAVAALNTQAQLNMDQSDLINNLTVNLSFLTVLSWWCSLHLFLSCCINPIVHVKRHAGRVVVNPRMKQVKRMEHSVFNTACSDACVLTYAPVM